MENLTDDQANSSKSSEDINEEKRIRIAQLEKDIAHQKSILVELKKQMNSYNHDVDLSHSSEPDIIIDIKEELYKFAGVHCVQLEAGYVFQFSIGCKVTENDIYCVEILKSGGQYKLGRWVMPMSIHLKDMVLQYPLHSLKNFKPFLNCCKHHIDCYGYRREQYYQLKDFLADTRNCFVDTNLGYTHVCLHMSGIKIIDSEIIYNVILCMGYEVDRGLPSRMVTETREGQMLPQDVARHFSKYFRPFKKFPLQDAFEKVISDTRCFQWTKVLHDYDEVALFMEEEDEEEQKEEDDEEERDELDETNRSRAVHKENNKKKSKTKMLKNLSETNPTNLEAYRGGENSSHSEKEEERSNPGRKINKKKTRESVSVKTRKKSEEKLHVKAKNINIKKWLDGKVKSTKDKNENDIEEETITEKSKENLEERVNSKEREKFTEKQNSKEAENSVEKVNSEERENSKEKENSEEMENSQEKDKSREKENSREIEKLQENNNSAEKETNDSAEKLEEKSNATLQSNNLNSDESSKKKSRRRTLLRVTPKSTRKRNAKCIEDSGKLENIAKRQPVTKEIKSVKNRSEQKHTEDVTSKNNTIEKTLSKFSKQGETKLAETPVKNADLRKTLRRKSSVNNLSKKSITELAAEEDNASMVILRNIDPSNIISSTPISQGLQAKLNNTQTSEINEILSLPANAKSKETSKIIEEDTPDKEMSEKDTVSSSCSDDAGDENAYEQAKELLKDINEAIEQGKAKNTQKNFKWIKKKKKKGKVT